MILISEPFKDEFCEGFKEKNLNLIKYVYTIVKEDIFLISFHKSKNLDTPKQIRYYEEEKLKVSLIYEDSYNNTDENIFKLYLLLNNKNKTS